MNQQSKTFAIMRAVQQQCASFDIPPLTPAERVQDLTDELTLFCGLERASDQALERYHAAGGFEATYGESGTIKSEAVFQLSLRHDAAVGAQCQCQDRLIAKLKILMGGGTLEYCRQILEVETAGRL